MARGEGGWFRRVHTEWTPESWGDGYVDGNGRFRVYRPDYPGAYRGGYALRAHVVWWLTTGEVCTGNELELHHRDRNRLNDEIANLERISHPEHVKIHHIDTAVSLTCDVCTKPFSVPAWRVRSRAKEKSQVRYCSPGCAHAGRIGKPRRHTKPPVTQCRHGHAYDEQNTLWTSQGRKCRACKQARQRAARKKAA